MALSDPIAFVLAAYEKAAPLVAPGKPRLARYKPPTTAAEKPAPVPKPDLTPASEPPAPAEPAEPAEAVAKPVEQTPEQTPEPAPAPAPIPAAAPAQPAASPTPATPQSQSGGFFSRLFQRKPPQPAASPTPATPAAKLSSPNENAAQPQPAQPSPQLAAAAPVHPDVQRAIADFKARGTRADSFKSWFGDWENEPEKASKVVRPATGEPLPTFNLPDEATRVPGAPSVPIPVFHGTPNGPFHVFDKSKIANPEHLLFGPGFYFTEDPKAAEVFARGGQSEQAKGSSPTVMSYYLKAHNPFDVDKHKINPLDLPPLDRATVRAAYVQKALAEEGRSAAAEAAQEFDAGKVGFGYRELTSDKGVGGLGASKTGIQELLRKKGYDALTLQADDVGEPGKNRYWIVFDGNQAKSVNNRGTFDLNEQHVLKGAEFVEAYVARFLKAAGIATVPKPKQAVAPKPPAAPSPVTPAAQPQAPPAEKPVDPPAPTAPAPTAPVSASAGRIKAVAGAAAQIPVTDDVVHTVPTDRPFVPPDAKPVKESPAVGRAKQFFTRSNPTDAGDPGKWGIDSRGVHTYLFDTANGRYHAQVQPGAWQGSNGETLNWREFAFHDPQNRYAATGAGNAHEVFAKAIPATVAYVNAKQPPVFSFTATGGSRQKLYDRLVRSSAAIMPNYVAVAMNHGNGQRRYALVRRDMLNKLLPALEAFAQQYKVPLETLTKAFFPFAKRRRVEVLHPASEDEIHHWHHKHAWVDDTAGTVLKALDSLPAPLAIAMVSGLTGVTGIRTRAQAIAAYTKARNPLGKKRIHA